MTPQEQLAIDREALIVGTEREREAAAEQMEQHRQTSRHGGRRGYYGNNR